MGYTQCEQQFSCLQWWAMCSNENEISILLAIPTLLMEMTAVFSPFDVKHLIS